jgi:hypothetical protein
MTRLIARGLAVAAAVLMSASAAPAKSVDMASICEALYASQVTTLTAALKSPVTTGWVIASQTATQITLKLSVTSGGTTKQYTGFACKMVGGKLSAVTQ